jgi:hypothetical protein
MTSTCELCGAQLVTPVDAVLHYERWGGTRDSDCDRTIARQGRPGNRAIRVVSIGAGLDIIRRRQAS